MTAVIKSIDCGSPASRSRLHIGDSIISINGNKIEDVLDYKYYSYDPVLQIAAKSENGKYKVVLVKKDEGEDLGLEFEHYLMDNMRRCSNKCVFCFIDQLPRGLRKTLYFKDDDARMSFLMGNYITLTNLSEREIERIIQLKISPINVSVHTTNPELRSLMLGNPRGGEGIAVMRHFAENGIKMNCQIVCCPGLNDGFELERSLRELTEMYPGVSSVSVVPVGLSKHRDGLYPLKPFDKEKAAETIDIVDTYGDACLSRLGTRLFFCADELYLKAGRELPDEEYYEEYVQLENGVGMMRLMISEFDSALTLADKAENMPFSIVTGISAAPFIRALLDKAKTKFPEISGEVFAVRNDFFGETIDVAGLITGGDIIKQLKGKNLSKRLIIPQNMLRHKEGVFLDDVTIEDLERELSVEIIPAAQDGGVLLDKMLGL